MARLVVNAGTPQARELVLKDGVNSVGRGETNDFVLSDPSVSGSHCQFIVANGTVSLRDLGSTNGTFVNGARVTEVELKARQQIHLGATPVMFEPEKEEMTVAPAPRAIPIAVTIPRAATATTAVAPPKPVGLRVAGVAAKEPPIIIPDADSEAAAAEAEPVSRFRAPPNAKCKYHPKTLARWMCTGCGKTYCDLCVAERHSGGIQQRFCRSCGATTIPLEVTIEAPQEKSFFRELPRAFVYPFRGTGVLVLAFATILFAALDFLGAGIIGILVKAMAIGYLYSYMQTILHSTAADDQEMPGMPAMDDLFSGCFRLIGTVLIAFGPAMVLAYLAIAQEQPMAGIALIPALVFGALYLPMAFLAVAMKDNVMAANPLIVIPSICRVPLEYLVTAVLACGIFAARYAGDALTSAMAGESMMGTSVTMMLLLFGLRAVWAFFGVYLLTVTMRILGLLYLTKRERLGW
jgi:hypothetical protein